jgi:hypothetical protein
LFLFIESAEIIASDLGLMRITAFHVTQSSGFLEEQACAVAGSGRCMTWNILKQWWDVPHIECTERILILSR